MTRLIQRSTAIWAAGTSGSPSAAAAHYVRDLAEFDPEKVDMIPGQNFVGSFWPDSPKIGCRYTGLGLTLELGAQSGTGVPWVGGALLRACGHSEAGTTGFTYALGDPHRLTDVVVGALDPVDIKYNLDGTSTGSIAGFESIMSNAVGNASFVFEAGQVPLVNFAFVGQVADATAKTTSIMTETVPAAYGTDYPGLKTQDIGLAIDSVSPTTPFIVERVTFDPQAAVKMRKSLNSEHGYAIPQITGFNPVGMIYMEEPEISSGGTGGGPWNIRNAALARTNFATLTFTHNDGGSLWNEVAVSIANIRLGFPQRTNDGTAMLQVPFTLGPNGGFSMVWSDN